MDRPQLNAPVSRTAACKEEISAPRPPIMTRMLLLLFVSSIGSATGFYLLLSVVPLYATSGGGGGDVAAGLTTAALMFSTVVGKLVTPRLGKGLSIIVHLADGNVHGQEHPLLSNPN